MLLRFVVAQYTHSARTEKRRFMENHQRKGLSRRQLLGAGVAAGVTAALGLPSMPASAQQVPSGIANAVGEEIVFVNGRIHTMDRNNTVVNTVTIRNGR